MALVPVEPGFTTPRAGARRAAGDVSPRDLVDAIETALGHEAIDKASKVQGEFLVYGHQDADWETKGRISKDFLNKNFAILQGLLKINQGGIFRKASLREAMDALDRKWHHRISATQGKNWSEKESCLLHPLFIELRKYKRNCKTQGRSPLWMKTLFDLLVDDRSPSRGQDSTEERSLSRPAYSGPPAPPGQPTMPPSTPRPAGRPVVYWVWESPSKKKEIHDHREAPQARAPATTFYYDPVKKHAVKVCKGEHCITTRCTKKGKDLMEFAWNDGTTWQRHLDPKAKGDGGEEEEPQEEEEENEEDEDQNEDQDEPEDQDEDQDEPEDEEQDEEDDKLTQGYQDDNVPETEERPSKQNKSTGTAKAKAKPSKSCPASHRTYQKIQVTKVTKVTKVPQQVTKATQKVTKGTKTVTKETPVYKCAVRHREYSKTYHSVHKQCLGKGLSMEAARNQARRMAKKHCDAMFA